MNWFIGILAICVALGVWISNRGQEASGCAGGCLVVAVVLFLMGAVLL